jgi:hypothetical protein
MLQDGPKKTWGEKQPREDSIWSLLSALREAYGWKLLGMLAFSQWMCKGLVWGFCLTSMDFLFRDYAISGPRMQVYKAIVMLPWAMKPLFGYISDGLPILGYQKAPYMILASLAAVVAHVAIGFSPAGSLPIKVIVLCLLMACMQISVVDLLTEAKYAERIREHPERGPDLMTYVWAGITLGNLVATASVGYLIEHFGAHFVFVVIAIPAAVVIIPTFLNWMEEPKLTHQEVTKIQASLWEQKELFFSCGVDRLCDVIVGCSWFGAGFSLGESGSCSYSCDCSRHCFHSIVEPINWQNELFFLHTDLLCR